MKFSQKNYGLGGIDYCVVAEIYKKKYNQGDENNKRGVYLAYQHILEVIRPHSHHHLHHQAKKSLCILIIIITASFIKFTSSQVEKFLLGLDYTINVYSMHTDLTCIKSRIYSESKEKK